MAPKAVYSGEPRFKITTGQDFNSKYWLNRFRGLMMGCQKKVNIIDNDKAKHHKMS